MLIVNPNTTSWFHYDIKHTDGSNPLILDAGNFVKACDRKNDYKNSVYEDEDQRKKLPVNISFTQYYGLIIRYMYSFIMLFPCIFIFKDNDIFNEDSSYS